MKQEKIDLLVTVNDLQKFYAKLNERIERLLNQNLKKEFYTPKEFSEVTGMKYRSVIYYLNDGKLKARQEEIGGTWLIPRTEIERYHAETDDNLWNDNHRFNK
ncbi:MAG: helix-turn-helix domain-containing protein [Colwellia sp.]|nr:helix-turn-helix domain-containing protein [Colwellia sp.]